MQTRGLTFSELWASSADRDQVLALESDVERGDHSSAVRRAEGLLRDYVGTDPANGSVAEALLMAGVHGHYYTRLQEIFTRAEHSKQDALFCLFFLTDLELRMHGSGGSQTE